MKKLVMTLVVAFGFAVCAHAALPALDAKLGAASVRTEENTLMVGTGTIERHWRWTGQGLVTCAVKDRASGRDWVNMVPGAVCDWDLPGTTGDAELVTLSVVEDDDEGFTSKHLAVTAVVRYPASGAMVKFIVWVYPEAPGLRTQLWLKGTATNSDRGSQVDYLPINSEKLKHRAIGYYNDTQSRHTPQHHLIREEIIPADKVKVPWASILCLEDSLGGVAMVQESHKCVNRLGVNTGVLVADAEGVRNIGRRLSASDVRKDRYRWCWASWVVAYGAGDFARELAIKQFDRFRYPIVLSRDMYVKADTWGSCDTGRQSRDMGTEVEVLKEIDSVADLGIDMLQIDDGWQVSARPPNPNAYQPDAGIGWKPHPEIYPKGWSRVVAKAKEKGVRLGLWAPAELISLEDMKWNFDQAYFETWKLDFASLTDVEGIDRNIDKVREFVLYTDHKAQAAFDVTENRIRYGYFWAREYGCIFLSNRKPNFPVSVIPQPWIMLRENWELARYCNLNKFQLDIQNFARVNREKSDAYLYGHAYEVALGLMGVPLFFQTTGLYEPEARDEIRSLLAVYKQHREEMFSGYVFPIGEEPDHANWSGFQWVHPERSSGYLLIFRDRLSKDARKSIALRNLPGATLKVSDLRTGQTRTVTLDAAGAADFTIEQPADFLFCRYEIQ